MGEAMDPSIHKTVPRLMCRSVSTILGKTSFLSRGSIKVLSHWSEDREGGPLVIFSLMNMSLVSRSSLLIRTLVLVISGSDNDPTLMAPF